MAGEKLIYGGPLNSGAAKQIEFRQKLNSNPSKSVEEISLLNTRGGWVKITSGVNEIVGEDNKDLAKRVYGEDVEDSKKALEEYRSKGSKEASTTVLAGGILSENIKDEEANSTYRQGLDLVNDKASSYSNSLRGFKAMPGITDFVVKQASMNNGALKQIQIDIKVNTLEDLNIIDKLYFKPGFDILIEYGANVYLDQEGEVQGQVFSVSKKFLKGEDLSTIQEKTREYKEKTGGNYEALFASVTNFSWNYNIDGSYDCKVNLISKGELMESLEAHLYTPDGSDFKKTAKTNTKSGATTKGAVDVDDFISAMLASLMWDSKSERNRIKKKYKVDIFRSIELKSDKVQGEGTAEDNSDKSKNYHWYITLRDFLHLLDNYFIPTRSKKDGKPFSLSTEYSKKEFNTFHEHMSIDPGICFLPYTGTGKAWYFDSDTWFWRNSFFDNYSNAGGLPPKVFKEAHKKQKQRFGNAYNPRSPQAICLNINHLLEIQNTFLEESKKNGKATTSVFTLLEQVLDDCETVMGGINSFSLFYDKDDSEWSVIDKGLPIKETKKSAPKIKLTGTSSFITNLSISSTISSAIASTLSINASVSKTSNSSSSLLQFNKNLYNRYNVENPEEVSESTLNEGKSLEEIIGKIGGTFATYAQGHYDRSKFSDNASIYRRYSKMRLATEQDKERRQFREVGFPGIIPIGLSLTLDGITNLRCGEAFQVSKGVLPERYDGQVGFIVAQIEQKISTDNKWSTDIKARMFMLASNIPIYPKPVREEKPAPDTSNVKYRPEEVTNNGAITPTNTPWSAAFISYIALKGDSNFPKAAAHTKYAQAARSAPNWKALPASSTSPQLGDIIIKGRAGNTLNFSSSRWSGYSHGDLVTYISQPTNFVEKPGKKYHTIGGNVDHTCKKKFFTADSNGNYGNGMVIVLRPQTGVNVQAMINAATKEWKIWHEDTKNQKVDQETTANRNLPRSPLIFERLKTYWATVNYTNFQKDIT